MRPPFPYYGGKQRLAASILPLLPMHTVYVEPFAGSAAVMFAKPWPEVTNSHHYREVVNDLDSQLVNFYRVLRQRPGELIPLLQGTPYSREEYAEAKEVGVPDPIESARRYYIRARQSFGGVPHAGWGTNVFGRNVAVTWVRDVDKLAAIADRLHDVHVENDDALAVIRRWDSPQTLFYCDPPYLGTDMGDYKGYTEADFAGLLETLEAAEGSFLLSNYEQPTVPKHWERFDFDMDCAADTRGRTGKGRSKAKKAETADSERGRVEVVWRRLNSVPPRPEIAALYESGAYDCFPAGYRGEDGIRDASMRAGAAKQLSLL